MPMPNERSRCITPTKQGVYGSCATPRGNRCSSYKKKQSSPYVQQCPWTFETLAARITGKPCPSLNGSGCGLMVEGLWEFLPMTLSKILILTLTISYSGLRTSEKGWLSGEVIWYSRLAGSVHVAIGQ
ncbi:unnamed protein product [Penicillium roqueforti FM164]|uniref:Genomic scaffold, ProqFM164S02 n=1 Tax=Penicillium roqueforti (strain FM164) TaxID=1365484 RepID=W6Q3K1_PENRF|nr:unnamed protein product [Penicillium roqueforti FM164]